METVRKMKIRKSNMKLPLLYTEKSLNLRTYLVKKKSKTIPVTGYGGP
jgi:hypothetical protein